jgi:voltage-gated potassium channel
MSEAKIITGFKFIRLCIYETLEKPEEDNKKIKKSYVIFNWFLIVLICLNIIAVIVTSFDNIYDKHKQLLNYFEYFSIAIFTIEYLLRIWTSSCRFPKPKIHYVFSFYGIIDLLAFLPFFLPFIFGIDLRILRVFRLFRIFKLFHYKNSFLLISKVLKNEKEKLFATIFIMTILILFASSFMYFFENKAQPDVFPNIPATLWWAVATLTTVGYGDTYPITILGKLLGGIISILGIGLFAMPSGIIAMGLIQEIKSRPADPENIYSVLNTLEDYSVYIGHAVKDACEKLKEHGKFGSVGNPKKDADAYGIIFRNNEDNRGELFFGLSPKVFKMKDGKDFVYSLAIEKKAIKYESIDKEKYPYLKGNDKWVYIQIDRNIFSGENPEEELCDRIVDIVDNVYLKYPPDNTEKRRNDHE